MKISPTSPIQHISACSYFTEIITLKFCLTDCRTSPGAISNAVTQGKTPEIYYRMDEVADRLATTLPIGAFVGQSNIENYQLKMLPINP
jgi:hypothetical protein